MSKADRLQFISDPGPNQHLRREAGVGLLIPPNSRAITSLVDVPPARKPVDGTVSGGGYSGSMTTSRALRLAEWTGRILLLGAVAFWWGAIVMPILVSVAFPDLLPPDAIPRNLNPDNEGTVANSVSAVFLLITSLLAFANVWRTFGRPGIQNWIVAAGWTTLAITAAGLAWEETAEFKSSESMLYLGEQILGTAYELVFWPVLAGPLIVGFVLAMGIFIGKGLSSTRSGRDVRALLILGLSAWMLVVIYEVNTYLAFGESPMLMRLLEETLEFGGTLVIGLSAAIALRAPAVLRPVQQAHDGKAENVGRRFDGGVRFRPRFWLLAAITSVFGIVALGVVAATVYPKPLADARALTQIGAFQITLRNNHALVQELGALPAPPTRIDLRVATHDSRGRPGTMLWRVMEAGEDGSGRIFREGRVEVAAGEHPEWMSIDFPPLVEAEGRPLALQLIADVEPDVHLQVGATKTNRYQDGRLWIRGALAWPDQNIEFAAHGASELTRSKLRAMWSVFTSDWRWPMLLASVTFGPALVVFIPVHLVTTALLGRGSRQLRH